MGNLYYLYGCGGQISANNYCDQCATPENGRVRGVAFIRYYFEFIDPTDRNEWLAGMASGDIVMIPVVRGTYDGGSAVTADGFGYKTKEIIGINNKLTFSDPVYQINRDFYNQLLQFSGEWKIAFVTGSQVHLVDVPVTVTPTNPITEELTSAVVWVVDVEWGDIVLPRIYDKPEEIFICGEPGDYYDGGGGSGGGAGIFTEQFVPQFV
jgi:hypothetical protein